MPAKYLIVRYVAAINGRIINEKSRRDVASKLLLSTDTVEVFVQSTVDTNESEREMELTGQSSGEEEAYRLRDSP